MLSPAYNKAMTYAVGHYIDLRHLNQSSAERPAEDHEHRPALYNVGTHVIFLNMKSTMETLKVRTALA